MNIFKFITRKRVEQNTTRELVSEGEFPLITDEVVSLIDYLGDQMKTESWYLELSENAKLGVLMSNEKLLSRLINIQKHNNGNKPEED